MLARYMLTEQTLRRSSTFAARSVCAVRRAFAVVR